MTLRLSLLGLLLAIALEASPPQDLEAEARKWIAEQKPSPGTVVRNAWVSPDRKRATAAAVVGGRESDKAEIRDARQTEAKLVSQFQALLVCAARESEQTDWDCLQSGLSELGPWSLKGTLPAGITGGGVHGATQCAWIVSFSAGEAAVDTKARATVDLALAIGRLKRLVLQHPNLSSTEAESLLRESAAVLEVPEPTDGTGPVMRPWKLRHAQQAVRLSNKDQMGRGFTALMKCKGNWRAPEMTTIAQAGIGAGLLANTHLLAHMGQPTSPPNAASAILASAMLAQHDAPDGIYVASMGPGELLIIGIATASGEGLAKGAPREAALTMLGAVISGKAAATAELVSPQMKIVPIPDGQVLTGPFDVQAPPTSEELTWIIGGATFPSHRAIAWVVAQPAKRR